ncbi:hypothetical protein GCM10022402_36770 [Salinactinospora qingdaonensis]|uniref:Uncharacterized protein n=1 Tax=Salinactinospora qingdaonensis TaxID=702744 RepID=A0ABP7G9B5_9ACTN
MSPCAAGRPAFPGGAPRIRGGDGAHPTTAAPDLPLLASPARAACPAIGRQDHREYYRLATLVAIMSPAMAPTSWPPWAARPLEQIKIYVQNQKNR